jgi:hypothetical protein
MKNHVALGFRACGYQSNENADTAAKEGLNERIQSNGIVSSQSGKNENIKRRNKKNGTKRQQR